MSKKRITVEEERAIWASFISDACGKVAVMQTSGRMEMYVTMPEDGNWCRNTQRFVPKGQVRDWCLDHGIPIVRTKVSKHWYYVSPQDDTQRMAVQFRWG